METMLASTVPFKNAAGEEELIITCEPTGTGGLIVRQESAGDVTFWSFEESPHVVETCIDATGIRRLCAHFGADTVDQVSHVLAMNFTGYDAALCVRKLLRELGIGYDVIENPIAR